MTPETPEQDLKLYYTIGEVAEIFAVSRSLIRFWESEFDTIKPQKNARGERRYTKTTLDQIREVHELVKVKGFTIQGARQEIKSRREYRRKRDSFIARLKDLRGFLEKLKSEGDPR